MNRRKLFTVRGYLAIAKVWFTTMESVTTQSRVIT